MNLFVQFVKVEYGSLKNQVGFFFKKVYPFNIYLYKVNNGTTRKFCKIYSKLTIKTSVFVSLLLTIFVFIVNYCEHISHIGLVFPLLSLNNLNRYEMLLNKRLPSRHSLVQSQNWKHQNNFWNLCKISYKDVKTTSFRSFWSL